MYRIVRKGVYFVVLLMMYAWFGNNPHFLVLRFSNVLLVLIVIVILRRMDSIFLQPLLMVMFSDGIYKIIAQNNMLSVFNLIKFPALAINLLQHIRIKN